METRPYFIFGDAVACLLTGALVGALSALIFGTGWNMILAMFVGMALGMLLALPLTFLLYLRFFGAMEVMVPSMLTGMLAGMVVSMQGAMRGIEVSEGAINGATLGFASLVGTYVLNGILTRRSEPWMR